MISGHPTHAAQRRADSSDALIGQQIQHEIRSSAHSTQRTTEEGTLSHRPTTVPPGSIVFCRCPDQITGRVSPSPSLHRLPILLLPEPDPRDAHRRSEDTPLNQAVEPTLHLKVGTTRPQSPAGGRGLTFL